MDFPIKIVMFHSYVKLPEGIGVNESWWVQTFRHGRISTAKVAASESEIDPAPRHMAAMAVRAIDTFCCH